MMRIGAAMARRSAPRNQATRVVFIRHSASIATAGLSRGFPPSTLRRRQPFTSLASKPFSTKAKPAQPETPLTELVRDFLDPGEFYELLQSHGMDFYTGVPDSLLKDFCAYITDNAPANKHLITANEGGSIAVAAGYHLATKKFPVVYMQNSGFGNAVNPLMSLADPKIYSIPMLLLIGWRGEPGKKDEPQHMVQGKIMSSLLTDMGINFEVLPDYIEGARETIDTAVHHLSTRGGPYALLVKRQCFTPYKLQSIEPNKYELSREEAMEVVVGQTGNFDILVATTGFTSRELYEYREGRGQDHSREFLCVGSMGHASSLAMAIAIAKPSRQVICLDGDGAMLMHMGAIANIGTAPGISNFKHVLFNNGAHDSVGGQPTPGFAVNFPAACKACGYKVAIRASTADEITNGMKRLMEVDGPALLEIMVNKGARSNLGRPKQSPVQNKNDFMRFLEA